MVDPVRISTYDALIEAGFRVFNSNPAASLAEVATAAGVGRATLHRYFSGRDDLIRVLALQAMRELEEAANEASKNAYSYTNALHKILKAIIPLGERQWFLSQNNTLQIPEFQTKLKSQDAEFKNLMLKAQKEGLFPASCPVEWAMQTYDLMVYGAWQMVRDGHATQAQAANLAWATFKSGLKKTKL